MYLTHFGLQRRPFPSTPDMSCYYPATSHEQTLAKLQSALEDGESMVLLTGEAGIGKTLACHALLERYRSRTEIAFLTNSHIGSRRDLLQAILYDLSLPYEDGTEQELRLRLTDHLLKNFSSGKQTLLIVDEAHYLSASALEELRQLCNLEVSDRKAVQVILVAQPAISKLLNRSELASLRQRLAVRVALRPMDADESVDYLLHHVRATGGEPAAIFSDEAIELIARAGRGIPRLINQAAHQALLTAHEMEIDAVDAEVVLEVLTSLGLPAPALAGAGVHLCAGAEVQDSDQPFEEFGSIDASSGPSSDTENRSRADAQDDIEQDVLSYKMFNPPRRPA